MLEGRSRSINSGWRSEGELIFAVFYKKTILQWTSTEVNVYMRRHQTRPLHALR